MKTALLITTFNRPAYLKRCLASVKRTGFENVFIYDDCSSDPETWRLIKESGYEYKVAANRKGICAALLFGIEYLFTQGNDIVINLDGDALLRNDYFEHMQHLHAAFPEDIITGFHSETKNANGSERHEIVEKGIQWYRKRSVGGINMLWTRKTWPVMRSVIREAQARNLNWDHQVSLHSNGVICPAESLVQHIGIDSSMGHGAEQADTANTFRFLNLPNVTLVCVDDNATRGAEAIRRCTDLVNFGDVRLIQPTPQLQSKEAYSKFILKELHHYVKTTHCLIVQHDGYIKNPEAWIPEFMDYDYIGATWWYQDGKNVGNGGFSLRSKKLLQLTPNLPTTKTHPEDDIICRECRPFLESKVIKFAPEEIANQFSYEGYNQPGTWNGQFGFHGNRAFRHTPKPGMRGFIINQFLGLGDILFLVPLIRHWMELGHDVIWPIADEYMSIAKYFPDIQFCKKSDWPRVRYDYPGEYIHPWQYGAYQVKPLRWNTSHNLGEAMTTKYTMYGLNAEMWRGLKWERDYVKEKEMAAKIGAHGTYTLRSQRFGNITDGGASAKCIDIDGHVVDIGYIDGFTLLDAASIIENATEIHAVSSSCIYLFETLNLKSKEIHLYSRKGGERDFDMVRPLLKKKYIFHI